MAAVIGNPSFTIRDWCVEPTLNRLSRADEIVKIDPQNMKVLELLASRPGEVISQAQIEQTAWAGVIVSPNSVYQAIAQLRRALGDDRTNPKYIETIARKGYRLVAPRSEELNPSFSKGIEALQSPEQSSADVAKSDSRFSMLAVTFQRVGMVALLIIASIMGVQLYRSNDSVQTSTDTRSAGAEPMSMGVESEAGGHRAERWTSLAEIASRQGRPRQAISYYEQALDIQRKTTSDDDPYVGEILSELALLYTWIEDHERAEITARQALSLAQQSGSELNPRLMLAHHVLSDVLLEVGQFAEAESHSSHAVKLARTVYGDRDTRTASTRYRLALLRIHQGEASAAEALLRDALDVLVSKHGAGEPFTALVRAALAMALFQLDRHEEGASEAQEALRALHENVRPNHPYFGTAQQVLSDCLNALGQYDEAAAASRAAMEVWKANDEKPWRIARAASSLGVALIGQGKVSEGKEHLSYASRIFETKGSSLQQLAADLHQQRVAQLQAARVQSDTALEQ